MLNDGVDNMTRPMRGSTFVWSSIGKRQIFFPSREQQTILIRGGIPIGTMNMADFSRTNASDYYSRFSLLVTSL